MKFTIQRESLIKPLQMVSGVVERRQTLPILSNILVKIADNQLLMTATDLEVEMSIQMILPDQAKIQSGEITIPARKFMDICRALPDGVNIEISIDADRAVVKAGKSRFVLSTLAADDFPGIDANKDILEFSVPQKEFKQAIERTQFAMAHQDVRYYLNGMLFEMGTNALRLVATDGHRLALCDQAFESKQKENQQVIIPRKGIVEIARLLEDTDAPVSIQLGTNYIRVITDSVSFTSKLIDGRFPDYQNVLPDGGDKIIICKKNELKQALSRASILSNEKYRGVRLQFSSGLLRIFAHNPEQEEAEEELTIDYNGSNLEIGFNVTYLMDAVSACTTDNVSLSLSDANSCCLIQPEGTSGCKYVVMPMRL